MMLGSADRSALTSSFSGNACVPSNRPRPAKCHDHRHHCSYLLRRNGP